MMFVETVLAFVHFSAVGAKKMGVVEVIAQLFGIFEMCIAVLAVVMVRALYIMLLEADPS